MNDFKDKVAVITGAASGIGLGIARVFAQAGIAVALCDVRPEPLAAATDNVRALGGRALAVQVDVSERAQLERAADEVEKAFGRIDIICNNAGVVLSKPVEKVEPLDWDWIIGTNLYGVIHGIQVFLPRIRAHGRGGHVVNTSSIAGFLVAEGHQTGAYSATKYAVLALSEALAHDLAGTNIGVSVLAPAAVNTGIYRSPQHKPERFGGPDPGPDVTPEAIKQGMDPDRVGRRALAAIRDNDFYVFTHGETRARLLARHQRIIDAFAATERWAAAEGLTQATAMR